MSDNSALYAAVSGSLVQEKRLETLTNNLSNINTAGYKRDILAFRTLLAEAGEAQGRTALVAVSESATDFSQGVLRQTGNPLDLAIEGEGFFEVTTPEGPRYTRHGGFALNMANELVTARGDRVAAEGGGLTLDGSQISVGEDGEVTVDGASAGRVKIVSFSDLSLLEKVGENLFLNSGDPSNLAEGETASVVQGAIEFSNVNPLRELVGLIEVSRAYESFQKIIHSLDEANRQIATEVGQL